MGKALAAATPQDWMRWGKRTRLDIRKLLRLVPQSRDTAVSSWRFPDAPAQRGRETPS